MSDALRFETEPNGPPNVVEFGSIKTESGFHGLYAMSSYAHVRDGVAYPAVMFSTGANAQMAMSATKNAVQPLPLSNGPLEGSLT